MNAITKTSADEETGLAADLAAFGYLGLSYLKPQQATKTPAELLFAALRQDDLEAVQSTQLQNRLGFLITVARGLAEQHGEHEKATQLALVVAQLESSRLSKEDTVCQASLTQAERGWLRNHRPQTARHWHLLTDLTAAQLDYAA